ncbi:MAG: FecR domain-containing protein [Bacteroidota bacterium]
MTKKEFFIILDNYLEGRASEDEKNILNSFFNNHVNNLDEHWKKWKLSDKERIRIEIYEGLSKKIDWELKTKNAKSAKYKIDPVQIWKIAASIVVVLGIGLFYFLNQTEKHTKYITQSTSRGQKTTVTLSDGSIVKLNSESSITYPGSFSIFQSREIDLIGEAFFEIKNDPNKPFIVRSGDVHTKVLGTSFNVSAFPDNSDIKVTVASGKVSVSNLKSKVTLLPGSEAVSDRISGELIKRNAIVDRATAWKEGIIYFDNISLREASKILSRWYDVNFEFETERIQNCRVEGKFRSDHIHNVLQNIQFIIDFEFQFTDDNTVLINGEGCD